MKTTTAIALPIHITPHHLSLSPTLHAFVHKKMATVPRFASDALAADIVLRRHHGTASGKKFSASARLSLPGRDIHSSAAHADLYTAIVKLVSTLVSRVRKRNTRLAWHFMSRYKSGKLSQPATPAIVRTGADEVAAVQIADSLRHEVSSAPRSRETNYPSST